MKICILCGGKGSRLKNIGNVSRDFFQGDLPAFDKFRRPILDPETGLQLSLIHI